MAVQSVTDSFNLGRELWNIRSDGLLSNLTDVFLQGSEASIPEIPAHRVVLCARIPYFRAMFSSNMVESLQKTIQLQNISSATLNMIINYAYTSVVTLDGDNVAQLLDAAIFLGLEFLAETCWNLLEGQIDPDNCLQVYCLAERYQRTDLARRAKRQVLRHFPTVVQGETFLQLEKDKVIALIGLDDLIVEREEVVMDAVFSWIGYDFEKRTAVFAELMSMIRLAYVKPEQVQLSISDFISQMGESGPDLLAQIQQSIQAVSSVGWQPRESYAFAQAFLCFGQMVHCINPQSGVLTILGDMPRGLVTTGTAVMGRFVFVLGKLEGYPILCSYDLDLRTWVLLDKPHSSHLWGCVVALAGRIFAVGGINDRTVEYFTPETNLWERAADMPVPLFEFGYTVHQDSLFTFGGGVCSQEAKRVLRYEPETDVWTQCSQMPVARHNCSACLGDDAMIYVLGGTMYSGGTTFVKRFDAYNPLTNEWQCRDDLSTSGRRLAVAAVDFHIYVLGGFNEQSQQIMPGIQEYNELTRVWSTRAVLWPETFVSNFDSSMCTVVKLKIQR